MKSFSQLLESYATPTDSALVRHIKTGCDVENLFSKLEEMADKDGRIKFGDTTTSIKKVREYIGTLRRHSVLIANGLYAAR